MNRHPCRKPSVPVALLGATALASLLSFAAPAADPQCHATQAEAHNPAAGWIDPAQVSALVLFFPPVTTLTPPGDPDPNDPGDPNDPNDPPPDPPGDPPGNPPGDPPGDPPATQHNPEPASLISGILGAGLIAFARWRRRRRGE